MKLKSFAVSMIAMTAALSIQAAEPATPATKPAVSAAAQPVECPDCLPTVTPSLPATNIPPELILLLRTQDITQPVFTAPATQPAVREGPQPPATQPAILIQSLITQLGDDSPKVREEAHTKLRAIGKDALPALKEAAKADDPQIQMSAGALIAEIAEKDKPPVATGAPANVTVLGNGRIRLQQMGIVNMPGGVQVQMAALVNGQGMRDMTVNENGFKVHIHEDNGGLKMEVTDKGETREYAAKNAAELKEKEPEAFKIYEKYSAGNAKVEIVPERAPRD